MRKQPPTTSKSWRHCGRGICLHSEAQPCHYLQEETSLHFHRWNSTILHRSKNLKLSNNPSCKRLWSILNGITCLSEEWITVTIECIANHSNKLISAWTLPGCPPLITCSRLLWNTLKTGVLHMTAAECPEVSSPVHFQMWSTQIRACFGVSRIGYTTTAVDTYSKGMPCNHTHTIPHTLTWMIFRVCVYIGRIPVPWSQIIAKTKLMIKYLEEPYFLPTRRNVEKD